MAGRMVVFILLIFLVSCRDNKPVAEQSEQLPPVISESIRTDSTLLMNGLSLDDWEITNFGPQGPVYLSGGELVLGMGDGCTGVTYKGTIPDIGYEITLEACRKEGNDFFCGLTFPVKSEFCTFIAGGWGGSTVGISCINGKDAAENETTVIRNFEKYRWYAIRVSVKEKLIEVWIDGEQIIDLNTEGKKLSIRPEVNLLRPFGIASWNTTAGIRNIRVQSIQ